jgi:GMP synthase (glutamine-hydrolysing)
MKAVKRFLVAESEPREARETRRASVGRSSGETYPNLLAAFVPCAQAALEGAPRAAA